MAQIKLSKGSFEVDLHVLEVDDAFSNKIFLITPPTTDPSTGAVDTTIVDLLRITRTITLTANITPTSTKTAKEIKDDLISIYDGGGTTGGVTLSYDGDSIVGIIEKIAFNHRPSDIGMYWISADNYVLGEIVEHLGSYFKCIQDATGRTTAPASDGSFWESYATPLEFAKYTLQITFTKGVPRT